jgi:murein DD-endopeptidase MepM/ murein hydrolase activator NlpD
VVNLCFVRIGLWACTYDYVIENNYDNGKGVACFGKCMLIKKTDENILYILGHLHNYLAKPGDPVEPRMPIAIVGNTGYSSGAHLHVDARICDADAPEQIMNITQYSSEYTGVRHLRFTQVLQAVNPFDHSEPIVK